MSHDDYAVRTEIDAVHAFVDDYGDYHHRWCVDPERPARMYRPSPTECAVAYYAGAGEGYLSWEAFAYAARDGHAGRAHARHTFADVLGHLAGTLARERGVEAWWGLPVADAWRLLLLLRTSTNPVTSDV